MEVVLTWNLVLISVLVMLFAYNFLLGQNMTIKLILSIYIAILTADGIAKFIKEFGFDMSPGFQGLFAQHEGDIFVTLRIGLFLLAIVIFVIKGGFHVAVEKHDHWAIRTTVHGIFSALSSILFVSTLLIYLSGNSFVEGMLFAREITIYQESYVARIMIDYYQFWFSIPAIVFLITSFLFEENTER